MKPLVFVILAAHCALGSGLSVASDENCAWSASPLPEWERTFHEADRKWRGADAAYSVPLSPSKTLWLYGDTWITPPESSGRKEGLMIRNSLAIQTLDPRGTGAVKFFWRTESGLPAAAFVPSSGPGWLWPLSGLRIGGTLYVFFTQLIGSKSGLGFASYRSLLLIISNPDDPPERWQTRQVEIPFFQHGETGGLEFGIANLVKGDFAYVYGVREDWKQGIGGRSIILARTPVDALSQPDFSAWRFYSSEAWTDDLTKAAALFTEAGAEMSVSYLAGIKRFAAVYSLVFSPEIVVRLASRLEGPWEKPIALYKCPELSWNKRYFCYAGKAHRELATTPDELIITYAANSKDFGDHFRDLRLYWPRFLRVTVKCSPSVGSR
jgi:hypothetical protein